MSEHEATGTESLGLDDSAVDPGTDLARHLADISTVLLAPGAVPAAERIVSLAAQTMDSCDEAGLCGDGTPTIHVLNTPSMAALDRVQTQSREGPCTDALTGLAWVYVPDLLDDLRWPLFSPQAARLGMRSALAYRLAVDGETLGVLQLYAHLPAAFNATERAQGLIFATYAALALAVARDRQAGQGSIENLESAGSLPVAVRPTRPTIPSGGPTTRCGTSRRWCPRVQRPATTSGPTPPACLMSRCRGRRCGPSTGSSD